MSVDAINWAFSQDLPPARKLILIALADWADGEGVAFPGQALLSDKTSIPERTLRRHLQAMEDEGWFVRRHRVTADGRRTSDEYHLALPAKMAGGPTGQNSGTHRPTVAGIKEPSVEPPVKRDRARDAIVSATDWFAFWETYPRKVGKPAAARAWTEALRRGATPTQILSALRAHMPGLASRDPQYIPHPATWLNQERYLDPPEAPNPRAATTAPAQTAIARAVDIMALQPLTREDIESELSRRETAHG